jgi:uncharacterized membrane protein YfcA
MELLYLFFIGSLVGFVSSFLGIGGGSIMIPLLYILFPKLPPQAIIATSLGTIFLSSGLNSFRYKNILPPYRIIVNIFFATTIGALIGSQVLYMIPGMYVKKIFGLILLIAVVKVLTAKTLKDNKLKKIHDFKVFNTCFFGAIISSITGLGGGIIFVPLFMNLVKLPMKLISPYSNLAMTIATFMGVLPHFTREVSYENSWALIQNSFIGHVNPVIIGALFFGAFFASKLGVKFNNSVNDRSKRLILGSILTLFAGKILFY